MDFRVTANYAARLRGVRMQTLQRRTHYYANTRLFEQSLDVYTPTGHADVAELPLVVLVVGSAWLGHQPAIYLGTSWWNSSGPATVATLGSVCVCVRHRGAFPRPPPVMWIALLAAAMWLVWWVPVVLGALWHILARGAASHADMLDDVVTALQWVTVHRDELVASPQRAPETRRLIFGGYSSGAHVASSFLQRADLVDRALGPRATRSHDIDGVLLLSGVLGVRWGTPLPPPPASFMRFLPDVLVRACFGGVAGAELPSPVHEASRTPTLPHLLIGCAHEVFNLPFIERAMDVLFCSSTYADVLRERGVPVELQLVASNHWSVLNSAVLSAALRSYLVDQKWPSKAS